MSTQSWIRAVGTTCLGLAFFTLGTPGCGSKEEKSLDPAGAPLSVKTASLLEGLEPFFSFLSAAHFADVEQDGLLIDLGTTSRFKYTVGDWKTGWMSENRSADRTTNSVGRSGRLYFPVHKSGPVELVFRMRALGARSTLLFLNNNELPAIEFASGAGYKTYRVKVPAGSEKVGENYLLMRPLGDCKRRGKEEQCISVDWVRVKTGSDAGGQAKDESTLSLASLVTPVVLGGAKREAAALRAPGALTFYAQIPENSKLVFGVGAESAGGAKSSKASLNQAKGKGVRAMVTVQAGSTKKTIFSEAISGSWTDRAVDLGAFAGKIVKLRFEASGASEGRVAWSHLGLFRKKQKEISVKPAKNVVIVLEDTLRADKLEAFNPKTRVRTPVLKALAKEGIVFSSAQAPENWTKPSVASVLTSLFPLTHGTKTHEAKLPSKALMLSEHLKAQGFATGSFIANGYVSNKFGFDQGWDYYTNYIRESKSTEASNVYREAGNWIEKHLEKKGKDAPFFAYVHTIDPHVPYDPPASFLEMYDKGPYTGQVEPRQTANLLEKAKRNPPQVTFNARDKKRLAGLHDGEISYQDAEMGKFIERLKGLGVWKDTVFVFTSDHGEEFNEHGSWGHGHSVYQELLNVPLFVHYPAALPKGKRIEKTVSTLDIAPTVLEVLGKKPMPKAEGKSLLPILFHGARPSPEVAFSDFLYDRHVVRAGRYKLILRGTNATFFDLGKDKGEQTELPLEKHPIAVRYCRTMLGQFLGAKDRRDWTSAKQQGKTKKLKRQEVDMDDTTREQLKQLGYGH